ncbi:Phage tail protein OS=Streptomyces alboniger OX=132473 GN=CP975_23525 PE=4 SV=1 [Streptomyces alboniger]
MPHLTRTASGTSATDLRVGFGIPGFAHPLVAPVEWAELTRPGTPLKWVVLNVADGPGEWPDPHCLEAAGRLERGHPGARPPRPDIRRPRLRGARLRRPPLPRLVPGGRLLADRCPTERAGLPEVRRTVATLRALVDGAHVVLGHGTHPYPGYAEVGDQLVTFAGPWSDYRWSQVAAWTADHPPERFCHFVHGMPRGHLEEALRIARWQGASTIYFTDRVDDGGRNDPWESLPGYWDEIVSRIGTGISE